MSTRRSFQAVTCRLLGLAFGLSLLVGVLPAADGAPEAPAVQDKFLYLPLVLKPGQISGLVTENGVLVAGVQMELRFFDGATWSTRATSTTDGNGRYAFTVPSLAPGQRYYAGHINSTNSSRLGFWGTKDLTTYSGQTNATFATFDVADIILTAPGNDAGLNLPIQFNWNIRSAGPNDNYEFNLWDPIDEIVYYTNPLGRVNGYTLFGPPYVDQWYGWWVGVFNNGEYTVIDAYGSSFYFRWVYVWGDAAGVSQLGELQQVPMAEMLPLLIDPATDRPVRQPGRLMP